MTLAADELATTHGAVSRSMRELEETLGVRLLAGPKHRLQLTEQGRIGRATKIEMRYSAGEKPLRLWQGRARPNEPSSVDLASKGSSLAA